MRRRPPEMSLEDWQEYRARVRRRKERALILEKPMDLLSDPLEFTGEVIRLKAHGREYQVHEFTGKLANCMRAGKPYERKLLEHIYSQGFSGVAIDAGAHVGNHTLWMSVMCGLKVVAFEPGRYDDLLRNIELNGLEEKVTAYKYALSDRSERLAYMGRGKFRPGPEDKAIFETARIDDFKIEDVSLIKVDVEGMEPKVLLGAEETIKRCRPVIYAEEWGPDEHNAIAAVLEPWGYRMVHQFSGKESRTPVGEWKHSR